MNASKLLTITNYKKCSYLSSNFSERGFTGKGFTGRPNIEQFASNKFRLGLLGKQTNHPRPENRLFPVRCQGAGRTGIDTPIAFIALALVDRDPFVRCPSDRADIAGFDALMAAFALRFVMVDMRHKSHSQPIGRAPTHQGSEHAPGMQFFQLRQFDRGGVIHFDPPGNGLNDRDEFASDSIFGLSFSKGDFQVSQAPPAIDFG
jgi:hypothetical protein